MTIEEYNKLVNPDVVAVVDYGRWINLQESYPPLPNNPYESTNFELLISGDPEFECVFHDGENVRLLRYDLNNELLEWRNPEYTSCYWRFIPPPPNNEGYNCG